MLYSSETRLHLIIEQPSDSTSLEFGKNPGRFGEFHRASPAFWRDQHHIAILWREFQHTLPVFSEQSGRFGDIHRASPAFGGTNITSPSFGQNFSTPCQYIFSEHLETFIKHHQPFGETNITSPAFGENFSTPCQSSVSNPADLETFIAHHQLLEGPTSHRHPLERISAHLASLQ